MILVAGGTGTLGRALIGRLVASGDPVRVLTRNSVHAERLAADEALGDVRDARTLPRAVDGCQTVVPAVLGFLGGRNRGVEAIDDRGNVNLLRATATL